ncbi:box C/D snoRNA protein 1 [Bombina bombina]|uniref:box C/D snoRNA protein 1 n=1 Tax=Bombina bombina TaxID=8345 RepID=UPI00235AA06A|nr:box C/D snoRNA protein 1 [Bombina bombina]
MELLLGCTGGLDHQVPFCRKRKISLQSCETCGSEEAKYRCPRCMKYSCSLSCVKRHKTDINCNGVRDKTEFVPIHKFDEMNLLSDYRFLEDAGRSVGCAGRDRLCKIKTTNSSINSLKNRAKKFGIDLKTLPIVFSKRRENSTFFHTKEQIFYWHLKLLFPQSHAEYTEKRVPDNKTLHKILETYIDPADSDPVFRQRLKAYINSPSDVKVFVKVEQRAHKSVRYYELDSSKTLLENLKNKTIIEYPTLHVVLQESAKDYVVLDQESKPSASTSHENEDLEEGEIRDSS